MLVYPRTVPTTRTRRPLTSAWSPSRRMPSRPSSASSTATVYGSASRAIRSGWVRRYSTAPSESGPSLAPTTVMTSGVAGGTSGSVAFTHRANPTMYVSTRSTSGWAATRVAHRSGIGRARSTLRTPG